LKPKVFKLFTSFDFPIIPQTKNPA